MSPAFETTGQGDASLEEQIRLLLSPSDDPRWTATVRALDGDAALPILAGFVADQSLEWVARRQAALIVGTMGDPRGAGTLSTALKDPSEFVRAQAIASLVLLGSKEVGVAQDVGRALADPSDLVRKTAARAVGELKLAGATDRLREMTTTDPVVGVRAHAVQALSALEADG